MSGSHPLETPTDLHMWAIQAVATALVVLLSAAVVVTRIRKMLNSLITRRVATAEPPPAELAPPEHESLITDGPYGVYLLAGPEDVRQAHVDIVLFHGLQMNSKANKDAWWTTWQSRDKPPGVWPKDWLPDDLNNKYGIKARVLSVCYKANVLHDSKSADTIMPTLTRGLLQMLVNDNVGVGGSASGAQRRVVLVGHSLGGLIIKQLVVEANDAAHSTASGTHTAAQRFMEGLSGIVFYGTPHQGAFLADFVQYTLLTVLATPGHHVKDWLPVFSSHTANLNARFTEICHSRKINAAMCVAETRKTRLFLWVNKLVVTPASATLSGALQYHVHADHYGVCRPSSKTEASYLHFLYYVDRVVDSQVVPLLDVGSIVLVPKWAQQIADELKRTGVVCLHGLGGSGKTTLSQVIHNRFCNELRFGGRVCFLQMGKEPSNTRIAELQMQLLQCLGRREVVTQPATGRGSISVAVQRSGPLLLIVDDVWHMADLQNLLPEGMRTLGGSEPDICFGTNKSWLLVTTRNIAEVKAAFPNSAGHIACIQQLEPDCDVQQAMLLKWAQPNAGNLTPVQQGLVPHLVGHCHGLPLHLRLLGSLLARTSPDGWPSLLYKLMALKLPDLASRDVKPTLQCTHGTSILLASMETLEPDLHLLFLGFAVFFPPDTSLQLKQINGQPAWRVWCRLVNSRYDHVDIQSDAVTCDVKSLVNCSLLAWSGNDAEPVRVHDALREYAVQHVQSGHCKDSLNGALGYKVAGKGDIPAESVNVYIAKDSSQGVWSPCYPALRLLRLEDCGYQQICLQQAPQLRVIWITRCNQLERLELNGLSQLQALRVQDCPQLQSLPDSLSSCTALIELDLTGCMNLKTIQNITGLTRLRRLCLAGCSNLQQLPGQVGQLIHLQILDLRGCSKLKSVPDSVVSLQELQELHLCDCSSLTQLPNVPWQLQSLQILDLSGCSQLKSVPAVDSPALQQLLLYGCTNLESLPDELRQRQALQIQGLSSCFKLQRPLQPLTNGPYGVYQLAGPEPGQKPDVDIVFFHGLQFDSNANKDAWWTTWQSREEQPCVWPQAWLPHDLNSKYGIKARVLSVCYNASASKDSKSVTTIMPTLARGLFQMLVNDNVDVGGSASGALRRIVLVGHSLGGLIIKQLVKEAHEAASNNLAARKFMDATSGIVFYGTPDHRALSKDFIKHTQYLNDMFTKICNIENLTAPLCVAETKETRLASGISTLVVPTASAKLDGTFQYEVAADHYGVCKPPSRSNVIYAHFLSYVEIALQHLKVIPFCLGPIVPVPEWEQRVTDGLERTGVVCLHGMGGSGKTTLSQVIHNRFCNELRFGGRVCFLQMGKEPSNTRIAELQMQLLQCLGRREVVTQPATGRGSISVAVQRSGNSVPGKELSNTWIAELQTQLLRCLGRYSEYLEDSSIARLRAIIADAVQRSGPLFLIIDDVWHHADLERLLPGDMLTIGDSRPDSCFGTNKSWLLVTTRDRRAMEYAFGKAEHTAWVQPPDPDRELQRAMLCTWAGVSTADDAPSPIQPDLVDQFLEYCHGLPLKLRILGSLLRPTRAGRWQDLLNKLAVWRVPDLTSEDVKPTLQCTHGTSILLASMETLEPDLHLLFLGFAVFFPPDTDLQLRQMDGQPAWRVWCRLANSRYDKKEGTGGGAVTEEARTSARLAFPYCLVRSNVARLVSCSLLTWSGSDAEPVKVSAALREYAVQYVQSGHCKDSLNGALGYKVAGKGDIPAESVNVYIAKDSSQGVWSPCYPALRLLRLEDCGYQQICLQQAPQLRVIWITRCNQLERLELNGLSQLQALRVQDCPNLYLLSGSCTALAQLDLIGCSSLGRTDTLAGWKRLLHTYIFNRCQFARWLGELESLQALELQDCHQLVSLPSSLGSLAKLKQMHVAGCSSLVSLPNRMCHLQSLQVLDLSGCSELESLPPFISRLKALQQLRLQACSSLMSLSNVLGQLTALQILDLRGCRLLELLPQSISVLTALEEVSLAGCSGITSLPDAFHQLQQLRTLDLSHCYLLDTLPSSIASLTALEELSLEACCGLTSVPDVFHQLQALRILNLCRCSQLKSLPPSITSLTALEVLNLEGCKRLKPVPDTFNQLQSLRVLNISGCRQQSQRQPT